MSGEKLYGSRSLGEAGECFTIAYVSYFHMTDRSLTNTCLMLPCGICEVEGILLIVRQALSRDLFRAEGA